MFDCGIKSGPGKYTYKDGRIHQGNFKDNERHEEWLEISKRGVFLRNDDETYFPLWAKGDAGSSRPAKTIYFLGLHF